MVRFISLFLTLMVISLFNLKFLGGSDKELILNNKTKDIHLDHAVKVAAQNHQDPYPSEVPSFLLGQTHDEVERNLVLGLVPCGQNHLV
jgi:hypothetical protein